MYSSMSSLVDIVEKFSNDFHVGQPEIVPATLQQNFLSLFGIGNLKHRRCRPKPDLPGHDLELFRGYLRCCSLHLACLPLLAAIRTIRNGMLVA